MQSTTEGREPRPRAQRRRERILEAAGQCFARQGFAKTTVEEIAGAAGVSKGLVYTHFESKDALLDEVLERALSDWGEFMAAASEAAGPSPLRRLTAWHRSLVDYARSSPVLRSIFAEDQRVLLVGRESLIEQALQTWRTGLVDALREGVAASEIRPDLDLEQTADVIQVLFVAIVRGLFDGRAIDFSAAGLLDAAIGLVVRGLTAEGSA